MLRSVAAPFIADNSFNSSRCGASRSMAAGTASLVAVLRDARKRALLRTRFRGEARQLTPPRQCGKRSAITGLPVMIRTLLLLPALALMLPGVPQPARAQSPGASPDVRAERVQYYRPVRPRPRIRVTPAYPYSPYSTPFPKPYPYEYPGPGHVRQCTSWLAQEARPSGTVIVPRMRCWWVPGVS